jgi:apolipoprotein N-acyltransferase
MVKFKFTALTVSAKRLIRPVAAGILLSVPFWRAEYGWLVVPCMLGYLLWLDSRPSTKQIWLSGAAFFAVVVNWMYHIHATELIPNNVLAVAFLMLTFAIVVGSLSVGFLLIGYGYHKLVIDLRQPRSLLVLPALWALCEWARSLLFSVVGMGPGGSLGPHWNFGSLAFAASMTPLRYGARVVGQFGLSALVVLSALGILFLFRKQWKWGGFALGVVVAICATGWAMNLFPEGSRMRVGVVQLDDSSYSDYGYQRDLGALMASHTSSNPLDLLVLPEYSYIFTVDEYKTAETAALAKVTTDKSLVITSQSGQADQGRKNLVTFFKPDGRVVAQQEKEFLIPAGEYIPYFYEWILVLSGNTSVIGAHQAQNTVASSGQIARPVVYGADKIGALACSGAIAPDFYRRLTSDGATILTNSAALSTMGLSSSYYAQARQMASFIAVSNARPFVQSARGAEVYVLDSNGGVVAESTKSGVHYIEADVVTNSKKTPYSFIGDVVVLFAGAVAVAAAWFYRR